MKAASGIEQKPAFSFCLYSDREFHERIRISLPFIDKNRQNHNVKADQFCKVAESVPFSRRQFNDLLMRSNLLLNEKVEKNLQN
jgi:hypothetical protein